MYNYKAQTRFSQNQKDLRKKIQSRPMEILSVLL